ncbi:MAG: ribosome biogenesis GTPase Der [Blastocatellia bacterium]|nr:ribosome biogenesis GTPase Der [Blastocatellia bacterium]
MSEELEIIAQEPTERLPTVAIIGRPNVGKSTLFNRIVGSRRSIVGDLPGITRDRIYGQAEWNERGFQIVDTGGIVPDDDAIIPANIFKQARAAIDEASLLLFVVDVRAGVSPLDEEIAKQIRALNKPVFIVANKAETARTANEAGEFHRFGYDQVFPVSAEHGIGMADLLDAVMEVLPEVPPPPKLQTEINVAIIGRPNVGKSSLVNKLLGEERVIVSPIAGTTRDAVDSVVAAKQEGLLPLRIIDTAGIRRKGKTELMEEKMSVVMARKHIERADVALLLIDPVEGATHLDANIAGYAHDAGTSVIIVVNKWDLIEKDTYTAKVFEEKLRDQMRFLDYAPVIFLSAKSGQRVHKLHEMIAKANEARNKRVGTGQLNQFYRDFLEQPKATTGKSRLKVFYLTQASVAPPTFVLFTNARNGAKMHFSYDRYLINRLRETFDFYATPIRIQQRGRR